MVTLAPGSSRSSAAPSLSVSQPSLPEKPTPEKLAVTLPSVQLPGFASALLRPEGSKCSARASVTGSIYSFGYTLLIGVIANFVMGVLCTRLMIVSLSKFKVFRSKWLYGGARNAE